MERKLGLRQLVERFRVSARDRRDAAMHEAGHIVMARLFGLRDVFGHIYPRWEVGPNETSWSGETNYQAMRQLRPLERRMIAFAGAIAEYSWRREDIGPLFWEPNLSPMSPSDWHLAQCVPGELDRDDNACEAIRRVAVLLDWNRGKLWDELCKTARDLIVEERERRLRHQRLRLLMLLRRRPQLLASRAA